MTQKNLERAVEVNMATAIVEATALGIFEHKKQQLCA